jgi:hypothetical protein
MVEAGININPVAGLKLAGDAPLSAPVERLKPE